MFLNVFIEQNDHNHNFFHTKKVQPLIAKAKLIQKGRIQMKIEGWFFVIKELILFCLGKLKIVTKKIEKAHIYKN